MIPLRTHGNERPKLDCSADFVASQYGNRMVPVPSFSLATTLACKSFSPEIPPGHWPRRSVALQPWPFLLRGNRGGRFRNVDVGNMEAP